MTLAARLSLGFLSLAFPLTAFAAPPESVTNIKAFMDKGQVKVTWKRIASQDIASYRIFYSHASILKENGLYDDFESVPGSQNSYVFPSNPPVDTLYVSVLAVNKQGEESPYFVEEASVKVRGATASSARSQSSAAAVASTLRLTKAERASSTGILLTFSDTVTPFAEDASTLFAVRFGSGYNLPVTKADVSGNTVLLTTFPQTAGTAYLLQITGDVKGSNAQGEEISMDPMQLPVFVQEAGASSSTAAVGGHPDVTNLRLRATAEGNGRYAVEASWNTPQADGVEGYVITQSIDGGKTFGPALRVAAASRGVTVPHVSGASMGISVRVLYADGQTSRGVFQALQFGGQTMSSAPSSLGTLPPVGSVTGQNGNGGKLPESGVSLWAAALLAGAVIAWRRMRTQARTA